MMTKVTHLNFFIKTYTILSIQYMYKISCKMDKDFLKYSMFFPGGPTAPPPPPSPTKKSYEIFKKAKPS